MCPIRANSYEVFAFWRIKKIIVVTSSWAATNVIILENVEKTILNSKSIPLSEITICAVLGLILCCHTEIKI